MSPWTQPDQLVRHAEPVGEDLRKRRLVALADRLRAGDQRHVPSGCEADIDILRGRPAGALDVIGEAEAAQHAARLAVRAAARQSRRHRRRRARDRRSRESRRCRPGCRSALVIGIAAAGTRFLRRNSARSKPHLPRRLVDQPLDDVVGFGIAGAAQDADRRGVGVDRGDPQCDRRDRIDRARQECVLEGLHCRRRRPDTRRDRRRCRPAARGTGPRRRAPAPPRRFGRAPGGRRERPRCASRSI